jgi:AraC-like DNA-binding protein
MTRSRTYYDGAPGFRVGAFEARLHDPWFRDSGPISTFLFVFPRTSVTIAHVGDAPVVADRNTVMFYNREQVYTRGALSPAGDRCDWFSIPREAAVDAVAAFDPAAQGRDRPFSFPAGPCSAAVYARQRRLVAAAFERPDRDLDDEILDLLREVVAAAHRARGVAPVRSSPRAARRRRDLVEAARSAVARSYRERPGLAGLAAQLGTSPFHLSRAFKEEIGTGLHEYVTQLRLRRALELLEDPRAALTEIALDLGFSSHSHFTAAFRRAFAAPPSAFRGGRYRKRRKR